MEKFSRKTDEGSCVLQNNIKYRTTAFVVNMPFLQFFYSKNIYNIIIRKKYVSVKNKYLPFRRSDFLLFFKIPYFPQTYLLYSIKRDILSF